MKTILIILFLFPLFCFSQTKVMVNGLGGEHDSTVAECVKSAYPQAVVYRSTNTLNQSFVNSTRLLGCSIIVRSTTGISNYETLAENNSDILFIMPSSSNSHVNTGITLGNIISTGAGTDTNVTGYPIHYFAQDPTGQNLSSYSNGYIAGLIAELSDELKITPNEVIFWAKFGKTPGHDGYGKFDANYVRTYYEKYHRKIYIKNKQ